MFVKQIACPVCTETHQVTSRDGGVDVIACAKVTPTGLMRSFPLFYVKVLGAGIGVDEIPARVETEKDKTQRLQAAQDELRKVQEQEAALARSADLDARLQEVEAQLAAKGKK